ncbi:MAG: metal-dependent transcriptional regulator [Eubacteriales bacterium]|nr:metal-dependent transcriptional regulator [Eubacteriales bacterium]
MSTYTESVEDYLETILILSKSLEYVRSIDIASALGYKKSSVSVAMKNLRERNFIVVDDHGYISLTKSGLDLATTVYERHEWFTKWLISLGVDEITASEDACKMEHSLSKESFEAIKSKVKLD